MIPIIITIIFAMVSFAWYFLYKKINLNIPLIYVIAFLLFAIIVTCIFSKDFSNLKTYVTVILMFIVVYEFLYNSKGIRFACFLYIISLLFFSFIFLFHYRTSLSLFFSGKIIRLGSDFDNENAVGNSLLTGVVIALFYGKAYKRVVFGIIVSIIFSFVIFLTGSRMAVIGVFLSLITFIFLMFFRTKKVLLVVFLAILITLVILIFSIPAFSSLKNRIIGIFETFSTDGNADQSTANRFSMMISAFENWTKSLFIGFGANGFKYVSLHVGYSHSTISDILCNFGLIGAFLFFAPQIYCLVSSKKDTRSRCFFVIYIFGFLLIGLFGTVVLQRKCMYLILAIGYALFSIEHFDGITIIEFKFNVKSKPFIEPYLQIGPMIRKCERDFKSFTNDA
jgi:hypothetical protein